MNRRGPFKVFVRNDVIPGKFILEVKAYLFKTSSNTQRLTSTFEQDEREFRRDKIDDFEALAFSIAIDRFNFRRFNDKLSSLLETADEYEQRITNQDAVIFV